MAVGRTARDRARAAGAEGRDTNGEGAVGDDPRVTRRAALAMGGALAGAAAASATPAMAGHEPRQPTPNRPPPSSDLVSYEETVLAFRNHGFHLETLDRPITPLGSHYLLIHFDIPQLQRRGLLDHGRRPGAQSDEGHARAAQGAPERHAGGDPRVRGRRALVFASAGDLRAVVQRADRRLRVHGHAAGADPRAGRLSRTTRPRSSSPASTRASTSACATTSSGRCRSTRR